MKNSSMSSRNISDPETEEKIFYYEYLIRNRDEMSMTKIIKNLAKIVDAKKRKEIAQLPLHPTTRSSCRSCFRLGTKLLDLRL